MALLRDMFAIVASIASIAGVWFTLRDRRMERAGDSRPSESPVLMSSPPASADPTTAGSADPTASPGSPGPGDLVYAGPGRRFLSGLIDLVLCYAVVLLAGVPFVDPVTGELSDAGAGAVWVGMIGLLLGLSLWTSRSGRTLGKLVTRCAVVRRDDPFRHPGFGRSLLRTMVSFVWPWGLLALSAGRGQALDDLVARSMVVHRRARVPSGT